MCVMPESWIKFVSHSSRFQLLEPHVVMFAAKAGKFKDEPT